MQVVAARILEIFGDPLCQPPGILHVTSVWRGQGGALPTLRIGPDTPKSETDRFVLGLARARCDAIVTTGRILRDEPGVRHRLPDALADWRARYRGLAAAPVSVVLTGRLDLDPSHPLLQEAARVLVVTTATRAPALQARVANDRIEVVGRADASLRDTLDFLQRERGLASICVEAGPSSTRSLYADPLRVDELMLSVFEGERMAPGVAGNAFADDKLLARQLDRVHTWREAGWTFERLLRRRGAGTVTTGRR